jgi:hypothetical protein
VDRHGRLVGCAYAPPPLAFGYGHELVIPGLRSGPPGHTYTTGKNTSGARGLLGGPGIEGGWGRTRGLRDGGSLGGREERGRWGDGGAMRGTGGQAATTGAHKRPQESDRGSREELGARNDRGGLGGTRASKENLGTRKVREDNGETRAPAATRGTQGRTGCNDVASERTGGRTRGARARGDSGRAGGLGEATGTS